MRIRVKIHNQPELGDAKRVREYGAQVKDLDLKAEYDRDVNKGLPIHIPKNYYPNDDQWSSGNSSDEEEREEGSKTTICCCCSLSKLLLSSSRGCHLCCFLFHLDGV